MNSVTEAVLAKAIAFGILDDYEVGISIFWSAAKDNVIHARGEDENGHPFEMSLEVRLL